MEVDRGWCLYWTSNPVVLSRGRYNRFLHTSASKDCKEL